MKLLPSISSHRLRKLKVKVVTGYDSNIGKRGAYKLQRRAELHLTEKGLCIRNMLILFVHAICSYFFVRKWHFLKQKKYFFKVHGVQPSMHDVPSARTIRLDTRCKLVIRAKEGGSMAVSTEPKTVCHLRGE